MKVKVEEVRSVSTLILKASVSINAQTQASRSVNKETRNATVLTITVDY